MKVEDIAGFARRSLKAVARPRRHRAEADELPGALPYLRPAQEELP